MSPDLRRPASSMSITVPLLATQIADQRGYRTSRATDHRAKETAMSSSAKNSGKSAVVTGAGGGLGRDIALGLAAKGYVVFGTALSAAEVQDLKEASGGR